MDIRSKYLALILCAGTVLSLAACGGDGDVAGDDWRTTGLVAASGTITHDGQSVDVVVTVDEESAAFYWDRPEQLLYDSVKFPMTVPNARDNFDSISFDDLNGDGETDVTVDFSTADGGETHLVWLWEPETRYVFQPDQSYDTIGGDEDPVAAYVGLWEYQDENLWLRIHEDATWEFVNSADEVLYDGVALADSSGVELHFDGSGDTLRLDASPDGTLLDNVNGGVLVPTDTIQSSVPFFEQKGLELTAQTDGGSYLLKNGLACYTAGGNDYTLRDCYWSVDIIRDQISGGQRQLEFNAVCYLPDLPIFNSTFATTVTSGLYDYNTGTWLTDTASYTPTASGGAPDTQTIQWRGSSYDIEFRTTVNWSGTTGDVYDVMTKTYVVTMPEDYHGLVLAVEAQPGTYAELSKRENLDSICPGGNLMDLPTIDPYTSLYFDLG